MDFALTDDQISIRSAVEEVCADFDDEYWLKKDREGGFPEDFYLAMATAGWLGVAMPQEYGGAGLGISEACLMLETVAGSGACLAGASAIHMNVFGLHPVVVHGTAEQKQRWLPAIIQGRNKACFGVTEPNTGLNTLKLKTMAVRKGDHYVVNGQKVWISTAQVAHKIMLLARTTPIEEVTSPTQGLSLFYTDFDRTKIEVREIEKLGRKAERVLLAAEATGIGRAALRRAAKYAGERVVFDRPIGKNQGIQHPLAERWIDLEAGTLLYQRAAWLYDQKKSCGAEANAAKYFCAEAGYRAAETAVLTHGGFGYAKEYHVERYLREAMLPRIAPVSPQLILCIIAEKVLGLPKSY